MRLQGFNVTQGVKEGVETAMGCTILLIDCARGDFGKEIIGKSSK